MQNELKTMIVDDDEVSANLLEFTLNSLGIREIVMITSGRKAIEAFEAGIKSGSPYALVFLDIIMPGMDGQGTLKYMRAAEKEEGIATADKAVIIMSTSVSSTDAMVEALLEGDSSDYLVKPIDPGYIKEILIKHGIIAKS